MNSYFTLWTFHAVAGGSHEKTPSIPHNCNVAITYTLPFSVYKTCVYEKLRR